MVWIRPKPRKRSAVTVAKDKARRNKYYRDNFEVEIARSRTQQWNAVLKKHRMTADDFDRMAAEQGGLCAICRGGPVDGRSRLCIDHDHVTGRVRGLLCNPCNMAIGGLKDDPVLLRAAAEYIEKRRG